MLFPPLALVDRKRRTRRKYFSRCFDTLKSRYFLCAQVDIGRQMRTWRRRNLFPAPLFLIMRAVNGGAIPEKRSPPNADVSGFCASPLIGWAIWLVDVLRRIPFSTRKPPALPTPGTEPATGTPGGLAPGHIATPLFRVLACPGFPSPPSPRIPMPNPACSFRDPGGQAFPARRQDIAVAVSMNYAVADGFHISWPFRRMRELAGATETCLR